MGRYFLLFAILLMSFLLNAQGFWTPTDVTEVPKEVLEKFKQSHPNAENVHWGVRMSGKSKIFKVTAVEDGHHIKGRYEENGDEIEKIHTADISKLPDPVKEKIEKLKAEGWELERVYHAYNTRKNKDQYKTFFKNEKHPKKHLHIEYAPDGDILEKDYKKHSKHQVHD